MSSIEDISAKASQGDKSVPLRDQKEHDIRQACDLRDIDTLIRHATTEGGLLEDDLRRLACKSSALLDFHLHQSDMFVQGPFC